MKSLIASIVVAGAGFLLSAGFHASDESRRLVVNVHKDRLYHIVRWKVATGKQTQLDRYFEKGAPVFQKLGARLLGTFSVEEATTGDGNAEVIVLAEWPDLKSARAYFNDHPIFLKNKNLRDDAFEYLSEGYFQVSADGSFTFNADHSYYLISMWVNPRNAAKLDEYFQAIMPEVGRLGGSASPFQFSPAAPDFDYHPSSVLFARWPSEQAYEAFFNGEVFRRHLPKREESLHFLEEYRVVPILGPES